MVNIKGLLIFEKQGFKKKLKAAFGIYETEMIEYEGKSVYLLRTEKYNNTVRKRFIRKKVRELAVIPDTKENKSILAGEGFNLISKSMLLRKNLSKIVAKYSNSSGISKGRLVVGIEADDPTDILNKLISVSDWISEVYFYGIKNEKNLFSAEEFYKETGIGVILKKASGNYNCDILITEENKDYKGFNGAVLPLFDIDTNLSAKTIKGARINMNKSLKKITPDDLVTAELLTLPVKISGLIVEKSLTKKCEKCII